MSPPESGDDFLAESRRPRRGFVGEMAGFLLSNKRYWLVPILLVMVLFVALLLSSGSGVAPFIYTLF